MEFLLAGDRRAALTATFISTGGWSRTIALALAWNVIPALLARVQGLQLELEANEALALKREFLKTFHRSALKASRAISAIRALESAGIPTAAFKGLAAMAVLYGDAKHRTIHDGDLLIQRRHLSQALGCLKEHGFVRSGSETLAEYLQFVENSPGFAGNQALAVYGPDESEIDLHWQMAGSGLKVEDIISSAVTTNFMESKIPVVDSISGFVLTVHHAIRENLAVESACRDFLDVRGWCSQLASTGQLEAAMKRAEEAGCLVSALAVTGILANYDNVTPAAQAAEVLRASASPSQRRSAARLTEIFHYQLEKGPLEKDVFYLVHARPWKQILTGLGENWHGYRRTMNTLELRLGQARPLPERATLLARSIPGLRGLRLARELALVKFRMN